MRFHLANFCPHWGHWHKVIAISLFSVLTAYPSETAHLTQAAATPPDATVLLASANSAEAALAAHLQRTGARMYATYWCPYCQRQLRLFGSSSANVPYVECDPRGQNPQLSQCQAANVRSYPTWIINGQRYRGMRSLTQLANLSGYRGRRDFGRSF